MISSKQPSIFYWINEPVTKGKFHVILSEKPPRMDGGHNAGMTYVFFVICSLFFLVVCFFARIEDAVDFSSAIRSGDLSFWYFFFGWLPKKKYIQRKEAEKKPKDTIKFYMIKKQLVNR